MFPNLTINLPPLALLAVGFVLGLFARKINRRRHAISIILSPLQTLLPNLPTSELADLPYPPNALPGARDLATPYGDIRIYEWGPERGRKVLFVHGISTPSIALGAIVHVEAFKILRKG